MAVCLLLVLCFHVGTISLQSLFIDEANELFHVRVPWSEIASTPDSMPPLYAYLLKLWIEIWGENTTRWLSVLFSLATLVSTWWYGRKFVSPKTAVLAVAFLAVSPFMLYYAQLIRGYSLFIFLASLAIGKFAIAMVRGGVAHWASVAVVWSVGMYTHYYFALLIASLIAIGLLADCGRKGELLFAATVVAVLMAVPVLYSLKSDFGFQRELRDARPLSPAAAAYTYVSLFSGYTLGPSKPELHTLSVSEAAKQMLIPWGLVILASTSVLGVAGLRYLSRYRLARPILILLLLPVVLAGLLGAASGITYNVRFVAWCIVPLALLMASGIAESWRHLWGKLAAVALCVLSLIAVYNRTVLPKYQNEDLRSAGEYILAKGDPEEPVFVVSDYQSCVVNFYLDDISRTHELPKEHQFGLIIRSQKDVEQAIEEVRKYAGSPRRSFWIVYSRAFHGDPDQLLLNTLRRDWQLEEQADFAGVKLYRSQADAGDQESATDSEA